MPPARRNPHLTRLNSRAPKQTSRANSEHLPNGQARLRLSASRTRNRADRRRDHHDHRPVCLDNAWHAERARLDSLTALYDPGTLAVCDRLGLEAGWRCLDVGAGTGTLAQALAARVAPSGNVVAADIDTRFLEPLASGHLSPIALDVTAQPLPPDQFDLVHARLLLEHLPARDEVLANIIRAAKPGGWVLVEDFDWATALLVDPPSDVHDGW